MFFLVPRSNNKSSVHVDLTDYPVCSVPTASYLRSCKDERKEESCDPAGAEV